jgi:molybdate transport system ATP-binding protein
VRLEVRADVTVDAFRLDVDLVLDGGSTVALLGPNGAGKTTTLRVIAGLLPIDHGRVGIERGGVSEVWDEPSRRVLVGPDRRAVALMFQDYRLFPTMTVLENVAFGLRARGARAVEARSTASAWLERVGLLQLAAERTDRLSGGEAQRVALARALATDPAVLLLDEPLAALDVGTRAEVRSDLAGFLRAFAGVSVLVTHDPAEARLLADRVVVLEGGRVVQQGTMDEIAAAPSSQYVERLVSGTPSVGGTRDD